MYVDMIERHITVLWFNVIYQIVMRNGQRTCLWPHFGLVSSIHHVVGYIVPFGGIIPKPSSVEQEPGSKLSEVHGFGTGAQQNIQLYTFLMDPVGQMY